jgi:hypothetical protein
VIREVDVRADGPDEALRAAILEVRKRAFDPLRVLQIQPLAVQDGPGGSVQAFRVSFSGEEITESEARSLWGDR